MKNVNQQLEKHSATTGTSSFTLIEVALAIAVVVIGVLALFSLISTGLDASAKALADTHAAQFADNVFNGLRSRSNAEAEEQVAPGDIVPWREFWLDFAEGREGITLAAQDYWDVGSTDIRASQWAVFPFPHFTPTHYQLAFSNLNQHAAMGNIVNHALRYRIEVTSPGVSTWSVSSDWDLLSYTNARVQVTMYVWPGEFGSTNDPLTFYSEFNNPGDL